MPRLGAHLSIAGGLPRAVDRAGASGCQGAPDLHEVGRPVARARAATGGDRAVSPPAAPDEEIRPVVAHNSYLIKPGGRRPDDARALERVAARRARPRRSLGCDGLVMHPGSFTPERLGRPARDRRRPRGNLRVASGHEDAGAARAHCRPGHQPRASLRSTLAEIIDLLGGAARRRVPRYLHCSRGLESARRTATRTRSGQFGKIVGFARLKAFHSTTRRSRAASRVDRHEHIGKGLPRPGAIRADLNDPRREAASCWKRRKKTRRRRERRATSIRWTG